MRVCVCVCAVFVSCHSGTRAKVRCCIRISSFPRSRSRGAETQPTMHLFPPASTQTHLLNQVTNLPPRNLTFFAAKFMPADQPQQPMMMMGGQPMQQIPMQQMPAAPPAQPAAPAALVQDVSALLTGGGAQLIKN